MARPGPRAYATYDLMNDVYVEHMAMAACIERDSLYLSAGTVGLN